MQDPGMQSEGGSRLSVDHAVERLLHIEAIRLLRPRYCRFLDLKQWDEFEGLFTPDVEIFSNNEVGAAPRKDPVAHSPAEFRARLCALTDGASTAHACFNPEIEILGARLARGIWAMHDIVSHPAKPGMRFTGSGHYQDEYRLCDDGRWRISKATLTRIRMDPLPLPEANAVAGPPAGRSPG
jgi:SnoaL-like domain